MLCTTSADECTDEVKDIVANVAGIAADIAIDVLAGSAINILDIVKKAGQTALDLANSTCDLPSAVEFFTMNK